MQRTWLGFAVFIIFIGFVTLSTSYQYTLSYTPERAIRGPDLPVGEWVVSAAFEKGDEIFIEFKLPNLVNVPNGDLWSGELYFNITDPMDGNTTFRARFRDSDRPALNVTVLSRSDGLDVDESDLGDFIDTPEDLGGVTAYSGNYTVQAYTIPPIFAVDFYYPPDGTLSYLDIWEIISIRTYPYEYLRLISVILIGVGLVVSAWTVKHS